MAIPQPLLDFIMTLVCTSILFLLFSRLMSRARKQEKARKARSAKLREKLSKAQTQYEVDDFYKKNNYSWDYALALPVYPADKTKLSERASVFSHQRIAENVCAAGCETRFVLSNENDKVFLYIRASEERLLNEMDRVNMNAELDPDRLRELMREGGKGWVGLTYPGDPQAGTKAPGELPERADVDELFPPFDYVFAAYNTDVDHRHDLYRKFAGSILRSAERIKLILSILRHDGPGGAKLQLERLQHDKILLAHFPIHITHELQVVQGGIMNMSTMPWNIPHHDIREYFGEKVGLYFVWLSHYTSFLFLAAVVGTITWIDVVAEDDYSARLVPFFAIFMALWCTLFQEYWKRKESTVAMKWGMSDFESIEQERVDFEGDQVLSPVTRLPTRYFPPRQKKRAFAWTALIISICIAVVIVVVATIFVLKYFTIEYPVHVGGVNIGPFIPGVANAIQIQIMDMIYSSIAKKLNDNENHRTQTEYEDHLIGKTFAFQFVNSYASLIYIAFIKDYFGDTAARCIDRDCLNELSSALGTILIVRLLVGNIQEVGVPMLMNWWRSRSARKNAAKAGAKAKKKLGDALNSSVAHQFTLQDYDVFEDSFADYLEMAIQYGYTTLFVAAFPLAPVMSFVNNWIEIRVDGYKLVHLSKRPEPRGAQDIGTWQSILDLLSILAVITNVGIICFTGTFLDGIGDTNAEELSTRFLIFLAFEHVLLFLQLLLGMIVPDVPEETEIQLERADFYKHKIILNAEDDDDEKLADKVKPQRVDLVVYREEEAPDDNLA